jgi:hypothetical protein
MEEIHIFEKEGEPQSREITQSPCQTSVHQWTPKEDQPRREEVIEEEEESLHYNLEGRREIIKLIPSMQMQPLQRTKLQKYSLKYSTQLSFRKQLGMST